MVEATNVHKTGQDRVVRWLVRASKKTVHKDVVSSLLWAPPKKTMVADTEEGSSAPDPNSAIPVWKQKQNFNNKNNSDKRNEHGSVGGGDSNSSSGNELCLNIAGARTIQQLFLGSPVHNVAILSSFAKQTATQLLHLGLHPVGSRGVLEVLLQGPDDFDRAKQHLVDRLMGQWTKLSTDRFGTYVVQKCYDVARMQRREAMVAELARNIRSLSGNNHGRHVLKKCRVELYERDPEQWRQAIKGADRRKQMFDNTFGAGEEEGEGGSEVGESSTGSKKRSNGEGGDDIDVDAAPKKKRKRKRKKKSKEDKEMEVVEE